MANVISREVPKGTPSEERGVAQRTMRPTSRAAQKRLDNLFERMSGGKRGPMLLMPTGGTIEHVFSMTEDGLVYPQHSVIPPYLDKLQLHLEVEVVEQTLKDSRDITYADRKKILETIRGSTLRRILIPSGLFAIPDIGKYLLSELGNTDKTIVLYGARAPLEWAKSDAPFVTGFSMGATLALEPGVYASIDGRIIDVRDIELNALGQLERSTDMASGRLDKLFGMLQDPGIVHIADMGGTIGSIWSPTKDTAIVAPEPLIPVYLRSLELLELEFEHSDVARKDSRDLVHGDYVKLRDTILESPHRTITVPIGTYKMVDTAQFIHDELKNHPEAQDKTIVFYGAMIPLTGYLPSDASFNMGFGTASALVLPPGVYVVMNGRVFEVDKVQKNLGKGRFEEA